MRSYIAHGLSIRSELDLPELVSGNGRAEVTVHLGKVDRPSGADGARRSVSGTFREVNIFWDGVGGISVRDGRRVVVDPAPGVDERALRLIILGPSLGICLVQRGLPVFHASCVSFPSGGVGFLGQRGFGKSTTAAALQVRGHDLVTDDVMALDYAENYLLARPSFPQMKLWPDSVQAVTGESGDSLPLIHPNYEKRVHRISRGFAQKPVPLRCLFVLASGQEVEIVPLKPKDALLGVMPHWYGAQFDGELLQMLGVDKQLRACATLVKNVPTFLLKRPPSLVVLSEVVHLLEEHVAAMSEAPGMTD